MVWSIVSLPVTQKFSEVPLQRQIYVSIAAFIEQKDQNPALLRTAAFALNKLKTSLYQSFSNPQEILLRSVRLPLAKWKLKLKNCKDPLWKFLTRSVGSILKLWGSCLWLFGLKSRHTPRIISWTHQFVWKTFNNYVNGWVVESPS